MLTRQNSRSDIDLLQRVRASDPAATLEQTDTEAALLLDRILAEATQSADPKRNAGGRFRIALVAAVVAAALLVPAAIGFHGQLLDALQSTDRTPSFYDLDSSWTVALTSMKPASRNGRWTLILKPYRNVPGYFGEYSLRHNGRLVASGMLSYDAPNAMIHLLDMNGPNQCTEEPIGGTYLIQLKRNTITFEPFRDTCAKRRTVLAGHTFTHR